MRALAVLVCVVSSLAAQSLRPPSVPLVVHDPYFSIWSPADRLTDTATTHWTGKPMPMTALLRLDGVDCYRLMGSEPDDVPALPQTGVQVTPLSTICRFANDRIGVELTFFTPALPARLDVLSRPLTYLRWSVTSRDGARHDVALYFDVSGLVAVDHPGQQVQPADVARPGLSVASLGSVEQPVLQKKGDDLRIDWGTAMLAQQTIAGGAVSCADGEALRTGFARRGELAGVAVAQGAHPAETLALGAAARLSVQAAGESSHVMMLGYDDVLSIRYFGDDLPAFWRRSGMQPGVLLASAWRDADKLWAEGLQFDRELLDDLRALGGERYAELCALAYRQCLGANKLCADQHGRPLLFPKENFSNGCIATVDVIYPMAPLLLLFGADLAKAMLVPVLDYAASSRWKFPFAPHDLGTYPHATGQVYGGGERTVQNQMPVEESANLILLVAAVARAEGNADFAARYWPQLRQWADYLESKGFDPERQLCTDDFAGHLAHNVNLSAKAILALGAFAQLCQARHLDDDAGHFMPLAQRLAARWTMQAVAGDHTALCFDLPDTWSQKYNLVWDRVLGLPLFPLEVPRRELAFYRQHMNRYGLPLDSRATFTKIDWTLWSACLSGEREDFDAVVAPVWRWVHETPDRVPMCDWYDTVTGRKINMIARPVVGGFFVRALDDAAIWRKWFGRGARGDNDWAPLPLVATVPLVPTAEDAAVPWRYTFAAPGEGWSGVTFDDPRWQRGDAGFGTEGTPGAEVRTEWASSDIWLRREFGLAAVPEGDVQLWIHHDEDAEVFVNGVLAAKLSGYVTNYTAVPMTAAARATLQQGRNTLAVHCRQTAGGQYIDVGLVRVMRPR